MLNEKKRVKHSLIFPIFLLLVIWIVKLFELTFAIDLSFLGVYPRSLDSLLHVFSMPLVHGDLSHLYSNSVPLIVLGWGVFYFYRQIAYKLFLYMYILPGIGVWIMARESYHIGMSGVLYAMASFLFFSGVIRQNLKLSAISLIIVFIYGSMFWGVLPIYERMSWEGHLMGAITGFVLSLAFRKQGPQREYYDWELENDEEEDDIVYDDITNQTK